ncbi:MAG: MarR family transcriptional regulator [Sphingomonadales bacterium]
MAAVSDEDTATGLGVLGDLVGYHMRRASGVIANDFNRAIAGTGMRQVLFGILSIISANPGINQGNIGRALGIQRANMVSLVNELIDQGLVQRETDADDRRAFSLTLTTSGEAMVETCLERIRAHENSLMSDLSPDERATLVDLLGRIEARET